MFIIVYQHDHGDGTKTPMFVGPFTFRSFAQTYINRELNGKGSIQNLCNPYEMANDAD